MIAETLNALPAKGTHPQGGTRQLVTILTRHKVVGLPTVWMPKLNRHGVVLGRYTTGQYKTGKYGFPGGKVEKGESPEDAALRETYEETRCRCTLMAHTQPYEQTIDATEDVPYQLNLHYYMLDWKPARVPKQWKLKPTDEMDDLQVMTAEMVRESGILGRMFETERVMWDDFAQHHIERLDRARGVILDMPD